MSITLHHHPFTRAGGIVWMLEEVEVDYTLAFVDLMSGAHKTPELLALNPMGKLPILTDGDAVVTEGAAIGLYLADRYASGRLAPALDDPARGTYLRWSLFSPSVIEPGSMANTAGWEYKPGTAGWGAYDVMLDTVTVAIGDGPFLLGERFTMADMIFGGTLRFMLDFGMMEKRPVFTDYVERLTKRPAFQRAEARNKEVAKAHGLES